MGKRLNIESIREVSDFLDIPRDQIILTENESYISVVEKITMCVEHGYIVAMACKGLYENVLDAIYIIDPANQMQDYDKDLYPFINCIKHDSLIFPTIILYTGRLDDLCNAEFIRLKEYMRNVANTAKMYIDAIYETANDMIDISECS